MKKRIGSLCLALMMALSLCCTPAMAAQEAAASMMTLEKTEGEISVRNQKGKSLKVRTGGRLYNGYRLSTEEGYAWIGLDDEKLIKLDWNTEVTVKKSGKRLEVMLESGELFFNVSKPLKNDEQMYIRTSTMYTGIRGTSGILSTRENSLGAGADMASNYSSLTVLDGRVQVTRAREDDMGRMDTYYVDAGWKNDVALQMTGTEDQLEDAKVASKLEKIRPEDALRDDPFAADEVGKDPALKDRIEESNQGSDLQETLDRTPDALKDQQAQDKQKNDEAAKQNQDKLDQISKENDVPLEPVFPPPEQPSGPPPVPQYTVTFMYGDEKEMKTFGKQLIRENAMAEKPVFTPSDPELGGYWSLTQGSGAEYDFAKTPVTGSLTLYWVIPH